MKILHLVTKGGRLGTSSAGSRQDAGDTASQGLALRDGLAEEIIEAQREECRVEVQDLTSDVVDYGTLLEKVFEADSVQIW